MFQLHHLLFKGKSTGVRFNVRPGAWFALSVQTDFWFLSSVPRFKEIKNDAKKKQVKSRVRSTDNLAMKRFKMHVRKPPTTVCSLPWLHLPGPKSMDETSNCQKYPVITSSCCPLRSRCILGLRCYFSLPHLLAGKAGQALA